MFAAKQCPSKGIHRHKAIVSVRKTVFSHAPTIITRSSSQSTASQSLPLAGVRVLEVGQVIAGPFCGQLLG